MWLVYLDTGLAETIWTKTTRGKNYFFEVSYRGREGGGGVVEQ
jgi:hypothetical protein